MLSLCKAVYLFILNLCFLILLNDNVVLEANTATANSPNSLSNEAFSSAGQEKPLTRFSNAENETAAFKKVATEFRCSLQQSNISVCESGMCFDSFNTKTERIETGCAVSEAICDAVGCALTKDGRQYVCCCSQPFCNGKSPRMIKARWRLYKSTVLRENFVVAPEEAVPRRFLNTRNIKSESANRTSTPRVPPLSLTSTTNSNHFRNEEKSTVAAASTKATTTTHHRPTSLHTPNAFSPSEKPTANKSQQKPIATKEPNRKQTMQKSTVVHRVLANNKHATATVDTSATKPLSTASISRFTTTEKATTSTTLPSLPTLTANSTQSESTKSTLFAAKSSFRSASQHLEELSSEEESLPEYTPLFRPMTSTTAKTTTKEMMLTTSTAKLFKQPSATLTENNLDSETSTISYALSLTSVETKKLQQITTAQASTVSERASLSLSTIIETTTKATANTFAAKTVSPKKFSSVFTNSLISEEEKDDTNDEAILRKMSPVKVSGGEQIRSQPNNFADLLEVTSSLTSATVKSSNFLTSKSFQKLEASKPREDEELLKLPTSSQAIQSQSTFASSSLTTTTKRASTSPLLEFSKTHHQYTTPMDAAVRRTTRSPAAASNRPSSSHHSKSVHTERQESFPWYFVTIVGFIISSIVALIVYGCIKGFKRLYLSGTYGFQQNGGTHGDGEAEDRPLTNGSVKNGKKRSSKEQRKQTNRSLLVSKQTNGSTKFSLVSRSTTTTALNVDALGEQGAVGVEPSLGGQELTVIDPLLKKSWSGKMSTANVI